jgi:hypothetical protein
MSADPAAKRSRRSVLAAAAAGAAGAAAGALATAPIAHAAQYNLQAEADNPTISNTSITGDTNVTTLQVTTKGLNGVALNVGASGGGRAITAYSDGDFTIMVQGLVTTNIPIFGQHLGTGNGLVGNSLHGTGLVGTSGGWLPVGPADTGVYAAVIDPTHTGLRVDGRVVLTNRSGRKLIAKNKKSVVIAVPGVRAGNFAVATLATSRTGKWVTAATCGTDKVTVYLNSALGAATYVNWIVIG